MKTSFWRRWFQSLRGAGPAGPTSRARPRRKPPGLEALEDRVTPTLTPQMVLDVNTNNLGSYPSGLVAVGSTTYFTANGYGLLKSDGTAAGTVLVSSVGGDDLTNVNGTLFFRSYGGPTAWALWKSDGTAAGTVLVKDLGLGGNSPEPEGLTNVNGTLFFNAFDPAHGNELWKSDGTAAGTVLVKDVNTGTVNTGAAGSYPHNLTNVNGTLFFTADDGTHNFELWKSNGTAAGTVLVKDIYPNGGSSGPGNLTSVNGTLFFTAYGTNGQELWKSNGTSTGTVLVKDVNPGGPGSYPVNLTNVNGTLFFSADDGTNGQELWKSDGTAAGTALVKDVNPGGAFTWPSKLTNVNGTLFFTADYGNELWKSDGTAAGTVLVKDLAPVNLTNVNGTLFFSADDGATGNELWTSDGTAAGTTLVKDIYAGSATSNPGWLTNVNGTLMFAADDGRHGVELWKSDGTAAGTALVKDVNPINIGSSPNDMTDVNGTLFFTADDGVHGNELWKSDGTAAGTALVKDVFPGGHTDNYGGYSPNGSSPTYLTNVNGTLFFTAFDSSNGRGLWKSDGTAAGTVLLSRVGGGNLTNVNGTLFFSADDGGHGYELWKSDGTVAGTTLVKDVYPGGHVEYYYDYWGNRYYRVFINSSFPDNLTNVNGTLLFTASDGANGRELWKSDGTEAGTVLVKDVYPGGASSSPYSLTDVNGTLFFSASDGTTGRELWKSDGTADGTALVKEINPGSASASPTYLTNVNGTLFFTAYDGANGRELWKSDGTAAGTVLVKDVNAGSANSDPTALTNVNGTLFFTTYDATTGRELWKSDGTTAGTVLVKDVYLGSNSADPGGLTNVNGTLFFSAYDGTGRKLWQSDGTAAGTVLVANLAPYGLTNVNGTLFFAADDGAHGSELWRLADGPAQGTTLTVSGFPATVTAGVAGSFTVTARNADGTTNTSYRGTVHFSSSDPQAVLPADFTFTAADQGVHTFSATLKTAGSQSITANDAVTPGGAGTQAGVTVNPAAASRFTVAGFPAPVTAGVAGSFTVTAWDAYGNRATGYRGTVRFSSSDARAVLPANYAFTAADQGAHAFSATLKTAGYQSLTATDTANGALTGSQGGILVNAAAASRLVFTAPASVKANATFSLTVTVVDAYGNVVTGYVGTLSFSSSDSTANLPKSYTFTAADQGVHTFTGLRLKKRGKQTITATDTLNSSLAGSAILDVL